VGSVRIRPNANPTTGPLERSDLGGGVGTRATPSVHAEAAIRSCATKNAAGRIMPAKSRKMPPRSCVLASGAPFINPNISRRAEPELEG
jgi:hypothetical protein